MRRGGGGRRRGGGDREAEARAHEDKREPKRRRAGSLDVGPSWQAGDGGGSRAGWSRGSDAALGLRPGSFVPSRLQVELPLKRHGEHRLPAEGTHASRRVTSSGRTPAGRGAGEESGSEGTRTLRRNRNRAGLGSDRDGSRPRPIYLGSIGTGTGAGTGAGRGSRDRSRRHDTRQQQRGGSSGGSGVNGRQDGAGRGHADERDDRCSHASN